MFSGNKPYDLDRITRLVIGAIVAIIALYLILYVRSALVPFFVAWFIAYLINPIVLFVQKTTRIKSKIVSVLIVVISISAALFALCWTFIPVIIEETTRVIMLINKSSLPAYIKDYISNIELTSDMASKGWSFAKDIISTSMGAVYATLTVFATFVYLIFLSNDFETLSEGARLLVPVKYRERTDMVLDDVKEGMNRYFRGQSLVALCVGVLLAIGFSLISLPLGLVLGLFIGLLNMVPYLQVVGLIPMAMVSLLKSSGGDDSFLLVFGMALGVLIVVQIIQDMFLVPKIMGKITGLNPAIILLSLSIWGMLLGIIGMIIALPLTTILLSYYKRFIVNEKSSLIIMDDNETKV